MRATVLCAAVVMGLAAATASCVNLTGDQTIAEYCSDPGRANYDLCKQHRDIEVVRGRADKAFGVASGARSRADRAQAAADFALARNLKCTTRTVFGSSTGSCPDPGYAVTSCVQTRSRGAILRSMNDNQCRFNTRVREMQVRCCTLSSV